MSGLSAQSTVPAGAFWRLAGPAIVAALAGMSISAAGAQEWSLLRSPGVCTYDYVRITDRTTTTCTARAFILNRTTSEVIRCTAEVSGTQHTAPSVPETAPESLACRNIGRVFKFDGDYAIAGIDDDAVEENRKIRRRGAFVWSNAYWVYARSGAFDIRFCAGRHEIGNPDFGQRCSKNTILPDE